MLAMQNNHSLALVALAAAVVSAPLSAQPGEREDPRLRNDCRLAAQLLQTGHPAPRRDWALDAIRRCDDSGPQVLAEVWRSAVPSDPEQLAELFNASRDFNDRRVVDAVADLARRTEAPETSRIYALTLLYSYAVPGLYIDTDDLLSGRRPSIGSVSHDTRAHETRAVLGDLRPEMSTLLAEIAGAERDTKVGTAAATVLRYLRASP